MTNQNGIHSLNSKNVQKKLNNNTGRAPLTKPQQKQLNQHLLHQLNNDARGNIANQDAARGFRQAMDNAFITAIPNDNARFRSCIRNGLDLQQQFFDQRKENTPPSLSFDQFKCQFSTTPSHLHISYMGTRTHAIDLVVTRNTNGLFITVCNRGRRDDHHIFETYQCRRNLATLEEQHESLNQVLSAAYTAEITSPRESDIANFYKAFGEQAMSANECELNGFEPPPPTKDQKVENCVRASISAAHKWMATQEGCPAAHKAVKKHLIKELEKELVETIKTCHQELQNDSLSVIGLTPIIDPFKAIATLLKNKTTTRTSILKPLIDAWLRYSSELLEHEQKPKQERQGAENPLSNQSNIIDLSKKLLKILDDIEQRKKLQALIKDYN